MFWSRPPALKVLGAEFEDISNPDFGAILKKGSAVNNVLFTDPLQGAWFRVACCVGGVDDGAAFLTCHTSTCACASCVSTGKPTSTMDVRDVLQVNESYIVHRPAGNKRTPFGAAKPAEGLANGPIDSTRISNSPRKFVLYLPLLYTPFADLSPQHK